MGTLSDVKVHQDDDGITHINIGKNGKTKLGQMLAHFYESPFEHPYFGRFASVEGFWHYVQNKERDDKLRSLSGMAAKNYGKLLTWCYVERFYDIIASANYYKIEQNQELHDLFVESTLPFDLYYLREATGDAEGQGSVLIKLDNYINIIKGFEDNRILMHYGERPPVIDYQSIFGNK